MILTQSRINKLLKNKKLTFNPEIEPDQVGICSVDLRLGRSVTILKERKGTTVTPGLTTAEGFFETRELREDEQFLLKPGEFKLALTHEAITLPNDIVALIEGKSSLARWGLSIHTTSPLIQAGFSAPIALEMYNHGPNQIQLRPGVSRVGQIILYDASPPVSKRLIDSLSHYSGQKTSEPRGGT